MNTSPELHTESQAIITALLDSTLDDSSQVLVSDEALARFACGWITPEESETVVTALTQSADLRARLLDLREKVRQAEAAPSARKQIFEKEKSLAHVMHEAFKASVKMLSEWTTAWSFESDVSSFGIEEKRSLRGLLREIGNNMVSTSLQPAYSVSRGAQSSRVVVEPGNVFADISVMVAGDESLVARAQFSQPYAEPTEISLYVVEPSGAWSWIGSNITSGTRWLLKTPKYAAMLNLSTGDLAAHNFALSEGRSLTSRGWIALHINESLRDRGVPSPTRVRLRKTPVISNGTFAMSFELPERLREVYREETLTLSISIGSASYVLGSWKVKDLPPTTEVELLAPVEGVKDGEFQSTAGIQLLIRPS